MSKLAKYIIGIVAAAAVIFLVWYFSNIVTYILIAAVLAIVGKPLVDWISGIKIKNWRFPRWFAALVALVAMWVVAVVFLIFFIPLVFGKINELSGMDTSIIIDAFKEPLGSLQEFIEHFFAVKGDDFSIANEISEQLKPLLNIGTLNSAFSSIFSLVGGTVIALFSITFITFFFLKQDNLFLNMVVAVFPAKFKENIVRALDSITNLLIRYFTGIIAQSAIIMLVLSLTFTIWGFSVQTAIFMGVVMAILNVIPYIGPLIGGVICVAVGIISPLEGATMMHMVLVVGGTILVVKGLDDFILQPLLYSNRVKAHPLEIFIVILIAGSVAGILGMLLAIPVYTALRVFAKEFFNNLQLVQKLTEHI